MFGNWMKRVSVEIDSGCIYISGAVEFDDRPGPVRDALAEIGPHLAGGDEPRRGPGPARKATCVPMPTSTRWLFEIHGLILALHYEARFLKNPGSMARATTGFDNILARYGAPASASSEPR